MGERSDIFVRIRAKERTTDKNYKYETFFGLYFQWCYGERMISRLRSAINFAENQIEGWRGETAVSEERVSKFKRYLAINFDMQDIVEPSDLISDAIKDLMQGWDTAKADIFDQAQNHGYIYLDITLDDPQERFGENKAKIKYAFVNYEWHNKKYPLPPVMSVEQFADWDMAKNERKWYEPDPYWDEEDNKGWGPAHKETFLKEIVPTCKKNMAEIDSLATVMTEDERKDFVKFGRAFTRKILRKAEKKKMAIKEQREILTAEICSQEYLPAELHNKLLELVDKVYPKPQRE